MRYNFVSLAAVLAASILSASACLPEENTIDAPNQLPPPIPLKPVPLVSPEVAAAKKQQAEIEKKLQQFQNYFSPELREALDFMEWGPLPEGTEVPVLSYTNLPTQCFIEYAQTTSFRYENDLWGSLKANVNTMFLMAFTKNPKTNAITVGYKPTKMSSGLIYPNKSDVMFHHTPQSKMKKQTFSLDAPQKFFSQTISPAFFINIANSINKKGGKIKYPAENLTPLFQFFPPLPAESTPGATADWNYSLVFDPNRPADKQTPAKVELLTWLKVRDQKAALLRATWPADDHEWLAADPNMATFFIKKHKRNNAFLQQSGPATAEFIVAENGQVLMAHFKGSTITTTETDVKVRAFSRRKLRYETTTKNVKDVERGYFSTILRSISDCSGVYLKNQDYDTLNAEEIQTLTEEFISKYSIGRKKEAIALLSPSIRNNHSDEFIMMYLDEFFKFAGVDTFGQPDVPIIGKSRADGKEFTVGLSWRGSNKKLRANTYSVGIGVRINEKPYLAFLGVSRKPVKLGADPSKHTYDIMEISEEVISTLVVHSHPNFR